MHIMDLLHSSLRMDARLKAADPNAVKLPPAPIKPLLPVEEDEFGGNDNNRKVAAKRAADAKQIETGEVPAKPVVPQETSISIDREEALRTAALLASRPAPAPGGDPAPVAATPAAPPVPWNPNA